MAVPIEVKNQRIIEDSVEGTKQCFFLGEILTPRNRLFVACKYNIRAALFVITAVNQVEEQSCVLCVKYTMANFIDNQT